jgi:hypothetical protein
MKKTLTTLALCAAIAATATEPMLWRQTKDRDLLNARSSVLSKSKSGSGLPGFDHSNVVIKMNLSQLAFRNLSFQGEFAFHPKISVAIGFSRLLERDLPGAFYDEMEYFSWPSFGGYAVTPELRFYPGGSETKPAPNGFYIAPYLRYANYHVTQTITYQEKPGSQVYTGEVKSTYGGFNGGLMIGYQWIIAEHFSIDLWIIGFGYGKAKYTYSWRAPGANMSIDEQNNIKALANDNMDTFSLLGLKGEIDTTPNSVTLSVRGLPMYSFRFLGLCLGAAF